MVLWDWKYAELMEYFDEVDTREMQQGDVVIWSDPNNEQNCHVAVFDNYDGECWFFSQNPNPCQVMLVKMNGIRAFRRKKETPPAPPEPTPVVTPNVPRNEYMNQIEVKEGVTELKIRTEPGLSSEVIGYANPGFYNYFQTAADVDGYGWYRISDNNWIAYSDEWENVYPKKEDEYLNFKILDKKDDLVLVDFGNLWIKK